MLDYVIDVAFADGELSQEELDNVYGIGQKLGLEEAYISVYLAEEITAFFKPRTDILG